MAEPSTIGGRLAALRKQEGLTRRDVADRLMVSTCSIRLWETDEEEPDLDSVRRLSELYDTRPEYILDGFAGVRKDQMVEHMTRAAKLNEIQKFCSKADDSDLDIMLMVTRLCQVGKKEA